MLSARRPSSSDSCAPGLITWTTNSRIVHATAKTLATTEAFSFQSEVLGTFAHNAAPVQGLRTFWTISPALLSPLPSLPRCAACSTLWPCVWNADWCLQSDVMTDFHVQVRAPKSYAPCPGCYFLFHIGDGVNGHPTHCGSGDTAAAAAGVDVIDAGKRVVSGAADADKRAAAASSGLAHYSRTPAGPWIPLPSIPHSGCNNPAPAFTRDGTALWVLCNSNTLFKTADVRHFNFLAPRVCCSTKRHAPFEPSWRVFSRVLSC